MHHNECRYASSTNSADGTNSSVFESYHLLSQHTCDSSNTHAQCKAYRNAGRSIWAVTTGAFESRVPAGWYAFIHGCHACWCVLLSREVHLKGCTNVGGLLVLDEPQEVKPLLEVLCTSTHKLHCLDVQQTIYHVLETVGQVLS